MELESMMDGLDYYANARDRMNANMFYKWKYDGYVKPMQ